MAPKKRATKLLQRFQTNKTLSNMIRRCVAGVRNNCIKQLSRTYTLARADYVGKNMTTTTNQQPEVGLNRRLQREIFTNTVIFTVRTAVWPFLILSFLTRFLFVASFHLSPRVGSGAVRIEPTPFPDRSGDSKSRTKSGFRLFC